jgi:hypothetical protein
MRCTICRRVRLVAVGRLVVFAVVFVVVVAVAAGGVEPAVSVSSQRAALSTAARVLVAWVMVGLAVRAVEVVVDMDHTLVPLVLPVI